jgi:hypothetical protein
LIALGAFRCEVENGGLEQFFSNSAGHLGPDALAAAREAGHRELAALIEAALQKIGEPFPSDRDERNARLLNVSEDEWDQLTDAYYAIDDSSDLNGLMDRYVLSHAHDFFDR